MYRATQGVGVDVLMHVNKGLSRVAEQGFERLSYDIDGHNHTAVAASAQWF